MQCSWPYSGWFKQFIKYDCDSFLFCQLCFTAQYSVSLLLTLPTWQTILQFFNYMLRSKCIFRLAEYLNCLWGMTSNLWLQAVDILQADYEPSDLDILYAEGVTSSNGLACVEFSFPQSADDDIDTSDPQVSLPRYAFLHLCLLVHHLILCLSFVKLLLERVQRITVTVVNASYVQ